MKLNLGDYVRTKDGVIAKITDILEDLSIDCDRDVYDLDNIYIDNLKVMEIPYCCKDEYIIKSSPNIIDLIEVGDYVDGLRVIEVRKHLHNNIEIVLTNGSFKWSFSKNESDYDIKSIVTKEQFKRMEYEVK